MNYKLAAGQATNGLHTQDLEGPGDFMYEAVINLVSVEPLTDSD